MKNAGKLFLGLLAVGAGVGAIALASKSKAPTGVPAWLKGATVFGEWFNATPPADFDGDGNDIHFNADCTAIIVGAQFVASSTSCVSQWDPEGGSSPASDPTQLVSVRDALHDGESLCGFIAYLIAREKIDDAQTILAAIVSGLEPACLKTTPTSADWPPAMKQFVNWLAVRVNAFVITEVGGTNPIPEPMLP